MRSALPLSFAILLFALTSCRADVARLTPAEAARLGSSYIVVGRPILKAANPALACDAIRREIGEIA